MAIASCLVDTNILLRLARRSDPQHKLVDAVSGAQVHDARLVDAMRVHRVEHILTLNVTDFNRYSGITVAHPSSV